jgi:uncharacterized protein (DUF433 family)
MSNVDAVVRAFTLDQVEQLAGVSQRKLKYWDNTGFFKPEYVTEERRRPYGRLYSFQDVVALRVIGLLQRDHKIPLQELRRVAKRLRAKSGKDWAGYVLYVLKGRKVVINQEPSTGRSQAVATGEYVVPGLPLERVVGDVRQEARKLMERDPSTIGKIGRHRNIAHNAPVIEGTRIPTRAIMSFHAEGYSISEILKEYPTLTAADVRAAIEYEEQAAA